MASYSIVVSNSAEKTLSSLPKPAVRRIVEAMSRLGQNPYPDGVRKLAGEEDTFRIRVGTYRVIYEVRKRQLLILVLKVGHRKDIYR